MGLHFRLKLTSTLGMVFVMGLNLMSRIWLFLINLPNECCSWNRNISREWLAQSTQHVATARTCCLNLFSFRRCSSLAFMAASFSATNRKRFVNSLWYHHMISLTIIIQAAPTFVKSARRSHNIPVFYLHWLVRCWEIHICERNNKKRNTNIFLSYNIKIVSNFYIRIAW